MTSPIQPIIICQIGELQVFCYQTLEDWQAGIIPKEIFWQRVPECLIRGPFNSIYEATYNYDQQNKLKLLESPTNVIRMDFKAKKRIK